MGGAMSVKDADERFVARTVQLAELREQLAACFATAPETAQMDALLAQARELLEALGADIIKIKNDLGPDYNLGQFQALTHQIEQLVDSVDAIPFIYLYEEMVQRLPTGWKAVKGTGGHVWFRGTSIDNGLKVLKDGHFDSNYTRTGAYFGVGTYFTPIYAVAEKYGECVFGMNNPGVNILRVRQIKIFDEEPPTPVPGFVCQQVINDLQLEVDLGRDVARRITNSGNAGKMLTTIARELDYDAVEFLESDEGHILVVLKDLPVSPSAVVFLRVFK